MPRSDGTGARPSVGRDHGRGPAPLSVAGAHPAVVQLVTCCHFVSGSILPVFPLAMGPLILSASLSVSDEQPGIPQHATRTESARTVAGSKERIDCLLEKILSNRECGMSATAWAPSGLGFLAGTVRVRGGQG